MTLIQRLLIAVTLAASALGLAAPAHAYDYWLNQVDYPKLKAAVGSSLQTGVGVPISQVEAAGAGGAYFIDYNNALAPDEFTGLVPTNPGGGTNFTQHSTNVGAIFYGNHSSVAPNAENVTIYEANNWLQNILRVDPDTTDAFNPDVPADQPFRVQNHSWVYSYIYEVNSVPHAPYVAHPKNVDALRRFDYMLDTSNAGQGMTAVVGLDNNPNSIPYLMSHSYNAIVVGRTDGLHSSGLTLSPPTDGYGPGRSKPDIVAPRPLEVGGPPTPQTSYATPAVGSVATMMYQETAGTDAAQSEVIKAMLLAGATKNEFPTWTRTHALPLDDTFGAGELNVYNTYVMGRGGRGVGSLDPPTAAVPNSGWDYKDFKNQTVGDVSYKFVVPVGSTAPELSILLAWNIRVTDGSVNNGFQPTTLLKDFDLEFYNSSNVQMDWSTSLVDNVEHIYLQNLVSGEYTLKVTGKANAEFAAGASGWDYGLAWRMSTLFDVEDADFDNDGFVTGNDFLAWQRNVGKLVGALNADGDANGDGAVNQLDLSLLTLAMQNQTPPPVASGAISATPEPATLVSAAAALAALAAASRRARTRRRA